MTHRKNPTLHIDTKPHLICIEGSAGSGKTSLCHALSLCLQKNDIAHKQVAEFSSIELGRFLALSLANIKPTQVGLLPEVEFMLCIADKFTNLIESSSTSNVTTIVADRGFITQAVLGIPAVTDRTNSLFAHQLLELSTDWLLSKFNVTTFVLEVTFEENVRRLGQRFQRSLSSNEQDTLWHERKAYRALVDSEMAMRVNTQIVDSSVTSLEIATGIVDKLRLHRAQEHHDC